MERKKAIMYASVAGLTLFAAIRGIWKISGGGGNPEEENSSPRVVDIQTEQELGGASGSFETENENSSMSGETITNGLTGATYEVSDDPENRGRICLKLKSYSENNPQTVMGAMTAHGSDPGSYHESPPISVTVYTPDGSVIGSPSTEDGILDDDLYGTVPPGTEVCKN